MESVSENPIHGLASGGGEMGERIRAFDWAQTVLGPVSQWPSCLLAITNLIIHSPQPMVVIWGAEGLLLYNDGYALIAGGKHPSILGMPVLQAWPEVAEHTHNYMDKVFSGEAVRFKEHPFILQRNGADEEVWLDLSYSPVYDQQNAVAGVMTVITESTGKVYAEQKQQQSEERLKLALDGTGIVGIWDWNIQADLVFADARFAEWFSVDPERAEAGAPLSAYVNAIHPDDVARVSAAIEQTLQNDTPFNEEYRLVQRDSSIRWIVARGRCFYDENQQPLRLPGVIIDITERKTVEHELQKYSQQQSSLARFGLDAMSSRDTIAVLLKSAITMTAETLNTEFGKIIKRIEGTENGLHFLAVYGFEESLVGQQFNPGAEPHAAYTLSTNNPVVVEDLLKETRFTLSPILASHGVKSGVSAVIHANGKPFGVLEVDTTFKRHFTETEVNFMQTTATLIGTLIERKQTEERLANKSALIQDYANRLEMSNEDLNQFASVAAHDLQAPLRKVYIFADYLRQTEGNQLSAEGRGYIERMHKSLNRMQQLITDMLALARVDRDKTSATPLDFQSTIASVREELHPQIEESNAHIELLSSCQFENEPQQLLQLMNNLIGNAIKYRREGTSPHVQISCQLLNAQTVQIRVSDNGIGIKPEHRKKVFEIFQRLHNEQEYSGTGIGLAIAKRIVDRQLGTITIENNAIGGSTFVVTLPVK